MKQWTLMLADDSGFAFLILALIVSLIISAVILRKSLRSSTFKGNAGEQRVAVALSCIPGGKSIHNLMLTIDGNSHQIDHVLIHPHGIFVIETKNFSGMVLGNENAARWTQVLANGKEKRSFQNPIKQNNGHIYALSKALSSIGNFRLKGIVVFAGSADISRIQTSDAFVTTPRGCIRFIEATTVQNLTQEECEKIYDHLKNLKANNKVTEEEHMASIYVRKALVENQHICPRCGGKLVVREGKNGPFYGCSNYPRCTFTKKS